VRLDRSQTARIFPLSNWTENDIWTYALKHQIELAPLYYAAPRPVLRRGSAFIVVDEPARMRFQPDDVVETRCVRFRTLGCWPVTGAILSSAASLVDIVQETLGA
jgi:sulfate adenylyltransferase subunit 2